MITQPQRSPSRCAERVTHRPAQATFRGGRPPFRPFLRDDLAFARLVPRPSSAPTPTNRNESRRVAYTSRRSTVTSAFNCGSRPSAPQRGEWAASAPRIARLAAAAVSAAGVHPRQPRDPRAEAAVALLFDDDGKYCVMSASLRMRRASPCRPLLRVPHRHHPPAVGVDDLTMTALP